MHALRTRFLPLFKGVRTFATNSGKPDNQLISNLLKRLSSHDKTEPSKKMSAVKSKLLIEKELPAEKKAEPKKSKPLIEKELPAEKKAEPKKSNILSEKELPAEKKEKTKRHHFPKIDKTIEIKPAQNVLAKDEPIENVTAEDTPAEETSPITDPDLLKLSNLLQSLEKDATIPGKPIPSISGIFSGLRLDVKKMRPFTRLNPLFMEDGRRQSIDLLTGTGLDIFNEKMIEEFRTLGSESESLFDQLERESREDSLQLIPRNFFEEAVNLTKEGKLWNFPINNEQGLEADSSFHEHIFLERYLPLFPNKGPVRHFMELVVHGLSKNAFLTVKEKEDHILWFADYFKSTKIEVEA